MQLTVTIRDVDASTLHDLAEVQWRNPEQQASALLEQALTTYRARAERPAPARRGRKPGVANN